MSDEYEEIEIYEHGDGSFTDANGNPVDEEGNRLAQQPAPTVAAPAAQKGRVPKALIGGVAVLVLAVGGGVAYGMHALGQQNTVEDVTAAVAEKSSEVRESVEVKKEEVRESVSPEPEEPVRTGTRVTGAKCLDPGPAVWDGEGDPPEFRLRQEAAAKLPSSVSARVKKRDSRNPSEIAITQPEKARLFVYASDPAGIFSRATVSIAGGLPVVLSSGNVVEIGADDRDTCPTNARPSTYAVVNGKRESAVEIIASKSVGDVMYGVTGNGDIAELTLEKIEPEEAAEPADGEK
ncbi:hypothetical protein [Gordonia sihwensis]|uniref:hypothetical protein n=1 Tax=Gordonia sihwensis TaxID=173559 RepID=UPI0005EF6C78|nr:hypothetical protein [Gordonia sihwensis]KJR05974.1 hypothetical protein UG54_14985 [Gordonia sihwensis]